jgi:hypothetical protein
LNGPAPTPSDSDTGAPPPGRMRAPGRSSKGRNPARGGAQVP